MSTSPLSRMLLSLEGLSLGDAFGTRCYPGEHEALQYPGDDKVLLVPGPWRWTDDTAMALSVVEQLHERQGTHPIELMERFVARYTSDPQRGYGSGARKLLEQVARGQDPLKAARALFQGQGSLGNGAAMRVAPLGAYFADDLDRLVVEARLSSICTHTHVDGQAGAIAIALAAAIVWKHRNDEHHVTRAALQETLRKYVPESPTRDGVLQSFDIPLELPVQKLKSRLQTPLGATSSETVPFCIHMIARHLGQFGEGVWRTVAGGGDHDTTAAMVGGVLALHVGQEGLPATWLKRRETLPLSFHESDNP